MQISSDIKHHIKDNIDLLSLRKASQSSGMSTLYEEGLYYVKKGLTSIEEVERVTSNIEGI